MKPRFEEKKAGGEVESAMPRRSWKSPMKRDFKNVQGKSKKRDSLKSLLAYCGRKRTEKNHSQALGKRKKRKTQEGAREGFNNKEGEGRGPISNFSQKRGEITLTKKKKR